MSESKKKAKEKSVLVIKSCVNCNHIKCAKLYLDLYLLRFNDLESYNELLLIYDKKKQVLNCEKL
jgi:hypothetical protein